MILLPETEAEVALQVMDKTRQMVEKLPFHFRNKRVKITMSFGVSQMVKGLSRQEQFERADKALYQAKEHGRNRVVVASSRRPGQCTPVTCFVAVLLKGQGVPAFPLTKPRSAVIS